nr:hypothetical protein [uncultured Holophaga sp.]
MAGPPAEAQPPPIQTLQIRPGVQVELQWVREGKLPGSGEPCLIVKYTTHLPLSDWRHLSLEAEQVWKALESRAEGLQAGVVIATEPATEGGPKPHRAGWVWRRSPDGTWKAPDSRDPGLLPRKP